MKLLIGVTACHQAVYPPELSRAEPKGNAPCADASRETWIKDAHAAGVKADVDVRFFYGREAERAPLTDEVFLNVDDSYDGLVDKVKAICRWAYDQGYDFLFKADIDSYINIPNLLQSEFFDWDYAGRGWGLGYLLSRKAMKVVAETEQRRSWAEDSHVLRTLFAWGYKSPENKIKMYGDGRFVFLPNMIKGDLDLYDTAFIAVNPMTPERMHQIYATKRLCSILPITYTPADLWTSGDNRVQHCSVHNAFNVRGEKIPFDYEQWCGLTAMQRQPYLDWMQLVFAALENEEMAVCPTFEQWMEPMPKIERRALLDLCIEMNVRSANRIREASAKFKQAQLGGS